MGWRDDFIDCVCRFPDHDDGLEKTERGTLACKHPECDQEAYGWRRNAHWNTLKQLRWRTIRQEV